MYKRNAMRSSQLSSVEMLEGETIERKVRRIVNNKEPIKDGAPEIFTERKDGVVPAHNIRTDRWEIASTAMDAITRSQNAKRDGAISADALAAKMDGDKETVVEDKTIHGNKEGE